MMTDRKNWILLYVLALFATAFYAVLEQQIASDAAMEYDLYLYTINHGGWHYVINNIVNSCLMMTVVPAYLQKITHIDQELLFKVYPCLFFSLLPPFVYLIARKYMSMEASLFCALLVLCQFYFLYYPANGRVGIAYGFWGVFIWALLNNKHKWLVVSGLLIVFSHYGTAYIMVMVLAMALIYEMGKECCPIISKHLC